MSGKYMERYRNQLEAIAKIIDTELKRTNDPHFSPSAALRSNMVASIEASARLEVLLEEEFSAKQGFGLDR